jgi:hypothetical protein
MIRNSYDIAALLAKSHEWRLEADRATLPPMRVLCLAEAARCERMVRRSMEVPVIGGRTEASPVKHLTIAERKKNAINSSPMMRAADPDSALVRSAYRARGPSPL